MRLTIDTTEALSFEATEPGPYEMTVDKYEGPEKGDKSTFMWIYFRFADPALDKRCGRVRRAYPIDGKGAGFFRDFWKAATGVDIPTNSVIDVDMDDCLGRPVIVDIGNEEYQGKTQNTVNKVTSAG